MYKITDEMLEEVKYERGVRVLRVKYNRLDENHSPNFGRDLLSYLDQVTDGNYRIVLDLSEVEFIGSAGIGTIGAVGLEIKKRGGHLRLAELQKEPKMPVVLTRLDKSFPAYTTIDEAVASFQKPVIEEGNTNL